MLIFKYKPEDAPREIKRKNIKIKGKIFYLVEVLPEDLEKKEVKKLIKAFKGRILHDEKINADIFKNGELFNSRDYFNKSLISALANMIECQKDLENICIKSKKFQCYPQLYGLLRVSKKLTLVTEECAHTREFIENAFNGMGAVVCRFDETPPRCFDVFIDLDKTDDNSKNIISVKGLGCCLYPDIKYFSHKTDEIAMLIQLGVSEKTAYAVFMNEEDFL